MLEVTNIDAKKGMKLNMENVFNVVRIIIPLLMERRGYAMDVLEKGMDVMEWIKLNVLEVIKDIMEDV